MVVAARALVAGRVIRVNTSLRNAAADFRIKAIRRIAKAQFDCAHSSAAHRHKLIGHLEEPGISNRYLQGVVLGVIRFLQGLAAAAGGRLNAGAGQSPVATQSGHPSDAHGEHSISPCMDLHLCPNFSTLIFGHH